MFFTGKYFAIHDEVLSLWML